jgi:hypothetical protein
MHDLLNWNLRRRYRRDRRGRFGFQLTFVMHRLDEAVQARPGGRNAALDAR